MCSVWLWSVSDLCLYCAILARHTSALDNNNILLHCICFLLFERWTCVLSCPLINEYWLIDWLIDWYFWIITAERSLKWKDLEDRSHKLANLGQSWIPLITVWFLFHYVLQNIFFLFLAHLRCKYCFQFSPVSNTRLSIETFCSQM